MVGSDAVSRQPKVVFGGNAKFCVFTGLHLGACLFSPKEAVAQAGGGVSASTGPEQHVLLETLSVTGDASGGGLGGTTFERQKERFLRRPGAEVVVTVKDDAMRRRGRSEYLHLREVSGADALTHFGTHGTQEWTPGKDRGLSVDDYPFLLLGDLPVFYPYIQDNVGEAVQAKRRGRAVTISHHPHTSARESRDAGAGESRIVARRVPSAPERAADRDVSFVAANAIW